MSLCVVCVCVCVHMNVCQYTFGKIWSPYLDKATTPASAALPVPTSVCSIFVCSNSGMAANICDFQLLMYAITHWVCTDTWKRVCTDSGLWENNPISHIPYRAGELNLHQHCALNFGLMLYQLSSPAPPSASVHLETWCLMSAETIQLIRDSLSICHKGLKPEGGCELIWPSGKALLPLGW